MNPTWEELSVGDVIECMMQDQFPQTLRVRLSTPEACAYGNELIAAGRWRKSAATLATSEAEEPWTAPFTGKVLRFDGDSFCVVYCRPNSDIVQMASNIATKELAEKMADHIREIGGFVFQVVQACVLIAALQLVKNPQERSSA